MIIDCSIKGITPLMMARFSQEEYESKKDKNELPRESAIKAAYINKEGVLYVPVNCLFASIIEAGKYHKSGKNKITTQKSSLICGYVNMLDIELPLYILDNKDKKKYLKDFEVDTRDVVIPATGGRVMKHRPRMDEWMIDFSFEFDHKFFSEKEVRAFIDDAGIKCGLLSYRPSRKGIFGKFKVVKWEIKK
jgi:hypothetical protein